MPPQGGGDRRSRRRARPGVGEATRQLTKAHPSRSPRPPRLRRRAGPAAVARAASRSCRLSWTRGGAKLVGARDATCVDASRLPSELRRNSEWRRLATDGPRTTAQPRRPGRLARRAARRRAPRPPPSGRADASKHSVTWPATRLSTSARSSWRRRPRHRRSLGPARCARCARSARTGVASRPRARSRTASSAPRAGLRGDRRARSRESCGPEGAGDRAVYEVQRRHARAEAARRRASRGLRSEIRASTVERRAPACVLSRRKPLCQGSLAAPQCLPRKDTS